MALIVTFVGGISPFDTGDLIAAQVGAAALTFVLRHRLTPPASMVFGSLGSRVNGAIKFADPFTPASVIPLDIGDPETPPFVLREICK